MNRSARRQLDRDLRKLMATDGDRCSLCQVDFPHNSKTFYGRAEGRAVIAGECCRPKLALEVGSGLYVKGDYDVLGKPSARRPAGGTVDDVPGTVERLRNAIAGIDDIADSAAQRAGISSTRRQVSLADNPWKADDAAWFQAHPDRSHRLRGLLPGELESFPPDAAPSAGLPDDHEIQIVIRQIQPGQRIRVPFGRNLETPIPDIEPVIHALFDSISARRAGSATISVSEVASIAKRYSGPKSSVS